MTHPLTDEMIDSIAQFNSDLGAEGVFNRDHDMRAAADWQLEQVIEWLEETECNQIFQGTVVFAEDLRKAMRPQQQE